MIRCNECGGIGEIQDMEVRQHGRFQMQWAPYDACNGTGSIPAPAPVIDPEKRTNRFDGPPQAGLGGMGEHTGQGGAGR